MKISNFDAKIIEMLCRIDEDKSDNYKGWHNAVSAEAGPFYFRDLSTNKLIHLGWKKFKTENDINFLKDPKTDFVAKVDASGKINGMPRKEFFFDYKARQNADKYFDLDEETLEEADVPGAPQVGDSPELAQVTTGMMPGPADATTPPDGAPIEGEEDDDDEMTQAGVVRLITLIQAALTTDPNTLELTPEEKKSLYTTVTPKNAEQRLETFEKILDDAGSLQEPEETPTFDEYK